MKYEVEKSIDLINYKFNPNMKVLFLSRDDKIVCDHNKFVSVKFFRSNSCFGFLEISHGVKGFSYHNFLCEIISKAKEKFNGFDLLKLNNFNTNCTSYEVEDNNFLIKDENWRHY